MNLEKESQLGAHAVMWAVMNKRQETEDLLLRNGISTTGNPLDKIVFVALKNSKPFRKDFVMMMAQYPEWTTSYMAMDGEFANVSGGVADTSLNLTTAINSGNTPRKSWFTADNIQGTLNTALNAFLQLDKNKTDRELAKASQNVAKYNAQQGGILNEDGEPKTKSNTTLYVVVGILAVALIGSLIYVASKKR